MLVGGFLARRAPHKKKRSAVTPALVAAFGIVAVCVSAFVALQPAIASHDVDSSTLGVGAVQNSIPEGDIADAQGRLEAGTSQDASAASAGSLQQRASRTITVEEPDPVVVLSAVDYSNPNTLELAATVGTTDPLPTAPRVLPDVSDGWSYGYASAYSFSDNDDGAGNFGTVSTASGVPLSDWGVTVAVPASQSYLLGRAVAIMYGETVIVATVTDTGGFGGYGRALDLAPGCWKAFGAGSVHDWGVRGVYYKFL